jgi:predicted outer membrane repeat protein
MRTIKLFMVLTGLLLAWHSTAFVTVGTDPDCDYDNLFPAYNDPDPEIRVTNQQLLANNFVIDKIKVFKGGYDSCQDAENNQPGVNNTRWSGLNAINNTVVEIDANLPFVVTVIMERFDIFDGENTTAAGAGGIKISGKSRLILRDSRVYDNTGNEGGGIHVSGVDASVALEHSLIENNTATGYGGGLFCTEGASITLDEDSASRYNTAQFNGGGLFAGQLCSVVNRSGLYSIEEGSKGLVDNDAAKGGGAYLQTGALYESHGSMTSPARIYVNNANQVDSPGGGGLYLTGPGTRAILTNTYIDNNGSLYHGGAFVVDNQARLEMYQNPSGCDYSDMGYCSRIHSNTTTGVVASGAAGVLTTAASATIAQTHISRNRSRLTAGIDVLEASNLKLEGNLITGHSDNSLDETDVLFVVRGEDGFPSTLDFAYNTVADNNTAKTFIINGLLEGQTLNVFNSVIWDQGDVFAASGNSNQIQIDCSVVHESQSLEGNVGVILTNDPLFTNTAMGDYRLTVASDAVDLCDQFFYQAEFQDLDSNNRGANLDTVNNFLGPYDAGAYEYTGGIIFKENFD